MRLPTLLAAVLMVAGCHAPAAQTPAPPDAASDAWLAAFTELLDASKRSSEVWAGWELRDDVLIAAVIPDGPTLLTGDADPPPDFRATRANARVFVRPGPPPDSLNHLVLGMSWDERVGAATVVSFYEGQQQLLPFTLAHEAFHTYQDALPGFPGPRTQVFADTSAQRLAWLNLEGKLLGQAIIAPTDSARRALAYQALAVRQHRCEIRDAEECIGERELEQTEGSANFATAELLGYLPPFGAAGVWPTGLADYLSPVAGSLDRLHFYASGHAWLLLVERFGARDWQHAVAQTPPDLMLAAALGFNVQHTDSIIAALKQDARWSAAWSSARELAQQALARQDVNERVLRDPAATPLRIVFGRLTTSSTDQHVRTDGTVEKRMRFNDNEVIFVGATREHCCPPSELTAVLATGQTATVDGKAIALDQRASVSGRLELDLANVKIDMPAAQLQIFADSIVITAIDP